MKKIISKSFSFFKLLIFHVKSAQFLSVPKAYSSSFSQPSPDWGNIQLQLISYTDFASLTETESGI